MQLQPWDTRVGVGLALLCLATSPLAAQAEGEQEIPIEQRFEALRAELDAALDARDAALVAAETDKAFAAALALDPWAPLAKQFDELAFAAQGSDVAAPAWALIFTNDLRFGRGQYAWEAFEILVNDHVDAREVESVVAEVQFYGAGNERALRGLHRVLETSSSEKAKGASLFSLAKLLEGSAETRDEAFGYYRRVVADYADVRAPRGGTFGERAAASLFEAEHLQVGMAVPDMAAVDENQSAFRLSDYEGKVVLVDFWGFW